MKKTITFLSSLAISASLSAQLYVNQDGNVGVNMSNPTNISFGLNNDRTRYGMKINGHGEKDLLIHSYADTVTHYVASKCGLEIHTHLQTGNIVNGIQVIPSGSTNYTGCAVSGVGGNATIQSVGVSGTLTANNTSNAGTGVFGSSSNISTVSSAYGRKLWAGFFRGDMLVTGTVFADVFTPTGTSQSSAIPGYVATAVSAEADASGESVSEKLEGVRLIMMTKDGNTRAQDKTKWESLASGGDGGEELTREQLSDYEKAVAEGMDDVLVPQAEKADVRYGLAADQLKAVFPELVQEDANGNVSINYIGMVPLLVQSLNEQRSEIAQLRKEIAALRGEDEKTEPAKKKAYTEGIPNNATDIISLGQNSPNPFSENTSIEVNIPESVRTAALFIYDMSGKQVDKISIADRGKSSVSVSATGLHEGMYLYSLIADGKVIDTRKMILTK